MPETYALNDVLKRFPKPLPSPPTALPSIDALLSTPEALSLRVRVGGQRLKALARTVTEGLRAELRAGVSSANDSSTARSLADLTREALLDEAARRLLHAAALDAAPGVGRVINATGVVLHTNLGRAPLSAAARRAVRKRCRLLHARYDVETGALGGAGGARGTARRVDGSRRRARRHNCAAAALLVLSALARDGETIVSRGELVEIGGGFRVPDVMAQSGTSMVEVGTTNRTKLSDYEREINERTRLILRVHPSNYRIVGFTASVTVAELARLAAERGLPLYEDAGSGALFDLSPFGLKGEPVIHQSIEGGAGLVSFSGDKLLGGAQAGLIVGRRELVERLRKFPLYRALRADKLTLAALEATLEAHRRGTALADVPALRMLAATRDELEKRARAFKRRLRARVSPDGLVSEIIKGHSAVGGGSAPTTHPETSLLALSHARLSAAALEEALRRSTPPVVARILEERVVLDLRTVAPEEESELLDALASVI